MVFVLLCKININAFLILQLLLDAQDVKQRYKQYSVGIQRLLSTSFIYVNKGTKIKNTSQYNVSAPLTMTSVTYWFYTLLTPVELYTVLTLYTVTWSCHVRSTGPRRQQSRTGPVQRILLIKRKVNSHLIGRQGSKPKSVHDAKNRSIGKRNKTNDGTMARRATWGTSKDKEENTGCVPIQGLDSKTNCVTSPQCPISIVPSNAADKRVLLFLGCEGSSRCILHGPTYPKIHCTLKIKQCQNGSGGGIHF